MKKSDKISFMPKKSVISPAGCIHKGRNLAGTNLSQALISPLYALEWRPFPAEAAAVAGGVGGSADIPTGGQCLNTETSNRTEIQRETDVVSQIESNIVITYLYQFVYSIGWLIRSVRTTLDPGSDKVPLV